MENKRIVAIIASTVAIVLLLWLAANREPPTVPGPQQSVASAPAAPEQDAATIDAPTLNHQPRVDPAQARQEQPVALPPATALTHPAGPADEPDARIADPQSNAREPSPLARAVTDPNNPRRKWLAVYELPGRHPPGDVAHMAAYLTENPIGADEYMGEEFAHRNYIMDVLREQQEQWPLVVDAFVKMFDDPAQGDVLRGYALQHLCSLYMDNPEALPQPEKDRIIAAFLAAMPMREQGTLAATALIGLHEVTRVAPDAIPAGKVDALALDLLRDAASGNLSRISALQIAGERGLRGAIPLARRHAADPQADWVVRMAAIWVLGEFDVETGLLQHLSRDKNENVRHAALAALAQEI